MFITYYGCRICTACHIRVYVNNSMRCCFYCLTYVLILGLAAVVIVIAIGITLKQFMPFIIRRLILCYGTYRESQYLVCQAFSTIAWLKLNVVEYYVRMKVSLKSMYVLVNVIIWFDVLHACMFYKNNLHALVLCMQILR